MMGELVALLETDAVLKQVDEGAFETSAFGLFDLYPINRRPDERRESPRTAGEVKA